MPKKKKENDAAVVDTVRTMSSSSSIEEFGCYNVQEDHDVNAHCRHDAFVAISQKRLSEDRPPTPPTPPSRPREVHPWETMSLDELKAVAQEFRVKRSGTKAELLDRLRRAELHGYMAVSEECAGQGIPPPHVAGDDRTKASSGSMPVRAKPKPKASCEKGKDSRKGEKGANDVARPP